MTCLITFDFRLPIHCAMAIWNAARRLRTAGTQTECCIGRRAARVLGDAKCLFHVHGKDTGIDQHNTRINGTLDTKSYADVHNRSWIFRTCGYGHGDEFWKPFVSMLRLKGYDGVISIEHEDCMMSVQEGFEKAVTYLKPLLIKEQAGEAWWF